MIGFGKLDFELIFENVYMYMWYIICFIVENVIGVYIDFRTVIDLTMISLGDSKLDWIGICVGYGRIPRLGLSSFGSCHLLSLSIE